MNSFEQNYWSSYSDFIENFKSLSYLGIPISLVIPYFVLIMDNAIKKLEDKSIEQVLNTKISHEKDIQSHFDKHLSPYINKINKREGKIVLYDTVLRLPYQMLKDNFDPSNTIILLQKSINKKNTPGFPTVTFINLQNVDEKTTEAFQTKAIECLDKFNFHPIYSDKQFRKTFITLIPGIMKQIAAAKKFFDTTPVSCLVLGTTNGSDTRSVALMASLRGIPTICLQHGVPMLEFGYLPQVAAYLAVYGKYDEEWYAKKGVPSTALKTIGHPRIDEIFNRIPMSKKAFQTHLKLDPEKKTVLLVMHHEETEFLQSVIKLLIKKEKVNIVVKRRNGKQTNSENTLLLRRKFPNLIYADDLHLYDLIQNCDAVVSYESTMVLESLLANKPVFIWKLDSLMPSSTNYYEQLEEYIFSNPSKLVKALTNTLEGKYNVEKWEKIKNDFIVDKYHARSGTSTTKLKALIHSLII